WSLNYLNGQISIRRQVSGEEVIDPTGDTRPTNHFTMSKKRVVVYDIWKFFQGRFTKALEDWKVGSAELLERMRRMKDLRAQFDRLSFDEVRAYCFDECLCMAELARKLTVAHEHAGIPLRSYFGAGSSASAMLDVMGIKAHIDEHRQETPM